MRVSKGGKTYQALPASGVSGILINVLGRLVFRVTDQEGGFRDYTILHDDLSVTIEGDSLASFYIDESGDEDILDHSPNVLGITPEKG